MAHFPIGELRENLHRSHLQRRHCGWYLIESNKLMASHFASL
jgi:hypothetical protein